MGYTDRKTKELLEDIDKKIESASYRGKHLLKYDFVGKGDDAPTDEVLLMVIDSLRNAGYKLGADDNDLKILYIEW